MIFYRSNEIKEFCDAMLDTYWEWEKGHYEVVNHVKRQTIWVCNGAFGLSINSHGLPIADKYYLHKMLKKLFAVQIADPLGKYKK